MQPLGRIAFKRDVAERTPRVAPADWGQIGWRFHCLTQHATFCSVEHATIVFQSALAPYLLSIVTTEEEQDPAVR
ncbi:hypothetical protein NX02_02865 [Sphingomonas sanxanigenens DSM 19645 = NX02]|uniref:Uncharacterized protein n=1 Tax=Sphingomonas sanxanigenens DSM 19645 = NX02 TaxID=1123269 RepID=W0A5K2_9SPHN|nr:hypothetical protein NX02_02865 [Sphingomonas sanxanigenens DSM 19645 = NX02]